MEETGFGVFEDKVVKNYIATEFLYDYLKDKRSVGVIDEDPERGIEYVAEPIGVVLALTPITNPTSTVLFKSIVAAKTRNAIVFRPSARAAGCAAARGRDPPGGGRGGRASARRAAGHPRPDARRVAVPLPPPGGRLHLDDRRAQGGGGRERGRQAVLSVGAGNAPVYIHGSADVRMAVVDMLISKTFDSSVICPAEQTCVIDDAVWDETVEELERMGARLLSDDDVERLAELAFAPDGSVEMRALGQSCVEPRRDGRLRDGRGGQGTAGAAALRPGGAGSPPARAGEADARARARPLALGRARARRVRARHRARRPRSHVGRLRHRRGRWSRRFARTRSGPAASSSTRRPRSARSAASTTR